MKQLSARQGAFVREYLIDHDMRRAAVAAGYSAHTDHALRLTRQPQVAAAIRAAMQERYEVLEITPERVLRELAAVAFSDIGDLVEWRMLPRAGATADGEAGDGDDAPPACARDVELFLRDSSLIPQSARAAVLKLRRHATGGVHIEMHDKLAALGQLAKHLGLSAPRRVEVAGKDGGRVRADRPSASPEMVDAMCKLTREQRDRLRVAIKWALQGTPLQDPEPAAD